ncbi:hypothetical protein L1049_022555 [Liquidambar formosana]|uniref:Uncharacterized protein n=1 Tax=Liquidambar formosana TaxID=63359 RepID=A0AAP0REN7_LIQFO
MGLSLMLHLPKLDETYSSEYRDLPEPITLPGCVPLHGRDLVDPVQDKKNDFYGVFLQHSKRHRLAAGILVNSFLDLEPGAFKALREEVESEEIAKYVRELIEGEEGKVIRNKMRDLKDAAARVLSQDGSSTESLAEVAQTLMNQKSM